MAGAAGSGGAPVALVTGGAGGIGECICRGLAGAGFRIVVGYNRSAQAAEALAAALPGSGHVALQAPVTDGVGLKVMAEQISQRLGRLDVLVNCAGTTRFVQHSDLEGLDDELFDDLRDQRARRVRHAARREVAAREERSEGWRGGHQHLRRSPP
ncbi:MAG: SDR family NAD(P)-dependent oxidoreductase [Vicinamibacterales bacterium]